MTASFTSLFKALESGIVTITTSQFKALNTDIAGRLESLTASSAASAELSSHVLGSLQQSVTESRDTEFRALQRIEKDLTETRNTQSLALAKIRESSALHASSCHAPASPYSKHGEAAGTARPGDAAERAEGMVNQTDPRKPPVSGDPGSGNIVSAAARQDAALPRPVAEETEAKKATAPRPVGVSAGVSTQPAVGAASAAKRPPEVTHHLETFEDSVKHSKNTDGRLLALTGEAEWRLDALRLGIKDAQLYVWVTEMHADINKREGGKNKPVRFMSNMQTPKYD
ncbi:uncharacterized protein B0T15DRAFT_562596 [Chaetomium strumarium]|uniref:Uncharacterized protein n=1 Tax=Chaetomium strumarium TaxID=1170767 RepID=A0AAJ0GMG7_9PEZI|nr:hypothetical protein B0T15DRAFT_562596 [Chaetomium strumarium]